VPVKYEKGMIHPVSRFTFVTRHLSKDSGGPFRHFLDLKIQEHCKIAAAYRYINKEFSREGFVLMTEEVIVGEEMVVFNFADEMIPGAVKMWESSLSKGKQGVQNPPIESCIRILLHRGCHITVYV
jgi:hypothetical protein